MKAKTCWHCARYDHFTKWFSVEIKRRTNVTWQVDLLTVVLYCTVSARLCMNVYLTAATTAVSYYQYMGSQSNILLTTNLPDPRSCQHPQCPISTPCKPSLTRKQYLILNVVILTIIYTIHKIIHFIFIFIFKQKKARRKSDEEKFAKKKNRRQRKLDTHTQTETHTHATHYKVV